MTDSNSALVPEIFQGNSKNYVPFVILSSGRSGSSLLTTLLNSHPDILAFMEIFHSNHVGFDQDGFPSNSATSPELVNSRDQDPVSFVRSNVYRTYSPNLKAVGYKMLAEHFAGRKELLNYFIEWNELRVIRIYRRNVLRQYLSVLKAKKTGIWYSSSATSTKNKSSSDDTKAVKVYVDVAEMLEFCKRVSNLHLYKKFENHVCLNVAYEDLLEEPSAWTDKLLKLLEVKSFLLHSPQSKQETRQLKDIIENFEEVRTVLVQTEWAFCLTMDEPKELVTSSIS